jgi:hypothetical protein
VQIHIELQRHQGGHHLASISGIGVRRLDARSDAMIRIDAMWRPIEPVDTPAGRSICS